MTASKPTTPDAVLLCQSCRYAIEATAPDGQRALIDGCPDCGDWLFLGDLTDTNAEPSPIPAPRKARR